MATRRTFRKIKINLSHHLFWSLNYYLLPHSNGAFKKIDQKISSLPQVTKRRHFFGSMEWRYRGRPIGHMHGNRMVDILFPKHIQSSILLEGKAVQNRYAKSGVSIYIGNCDDADYALSLLLRSYLIVKQNISDEHK